MDLAWKLARGPLPRQLQWTWHVGQHAVGPNLRMREQPRRHPVYGPAFPDRAGRGGIVNELQPAQLAYYRLTLVDSNRSQWADGLLLEFTNMMMDHPVLIFKRGDYLDMLNNDYILTSSRAVGRKRFKLEAAHLGEVGFVFGIFNMDYY
eukprot:jgi/Tetstr1/435816/TSEL_024704.t1